MEAAPQAVEARMHELAAHSISYHEEGEVATSPESLGYQGRDRTLHNSSSKQQTRVNVRYEGRKEAWGTLVRTHQG